MSSARSESRGSSDSLRSNSLAESRKDNERSSSRSSVSSFATDAEFEDMKTKAIEPKSIYQQSIPKVKRMDQVEHPAGALWQKLFVELQSNTTVMTEVVAAIMINGSAKDDEECKLQMEFNP